MPDRVRQIADAVLYEGYILWPYRRSALKNQQRWTFGRVYPQTWARPTRTTQR
jgi:hydrogenase maturation protease